MTPESGSPTYGSFPPRSRRLGNRHVTRRPRDLACRQPEEWCTICGQDPWGDGVDGCADLLVRGRHRIPLSWPPDEDIPPDNPCQCGAQVGYLHHDGCDIEICPWADEHPDEGEQLLCCECWNA
jgi:hypothetical protein